MKRFAIDPITAWLIAVVLSFLLFGSIYFFLTRFPTREELILKAAALWEEAEKTEEEPKKEEEQAASHLPEEESHEHKQEMGHGTPWAYDGPQGPSHWGELSEEYLTCKKGQQQSPIDLGTAKISTKIPELKISYGESSVSLINNGHTIVGNYSPGSKIEIGPKTFELKHFLFHSPSEHQVSGAPYPISMHLVHENQAGELVVATVFFEESNKQNPYLQQIWEELPQRNGSHGPAVNMNITSLLPEKRDFYTYQGSLTTPPCTEGVTWFIFKHSVRISSNQIDQFQVIYANNARPIQPTKGRQVFLTKFQ
ncbi:MAG: carbonic anhydrase family protein [Deltaproteobacteria bacterium]|nr:carbonic anhydrase family protein [Deltaproteobacteria bacterium]